MIRKNVLIGLLLALIVLSIVLLASRADVVLGANSGVLWSKQCSGDRVTVDRSGLVRCVQLVAATPTRTPRATPSPAPTDPGP